MQSKNKSFSKTVKEELSRLSARNRDERAFLRERFMACGYITDPRTAYRVELRLDDPEEALKISEMLKEYDIPFTAASRKGNEVIYVRSGDGVSDFLGLIGANSARLSFENMRVEKEMKSVVNRVVNCDSGNTGRQAEAAARRGELIGKLLASPEAEKLSPELLEAAAVHQNNPGASIAELGKLMNPPLGKSGMNHRLSKLVEIAENISM
ncbi:MAG: DNA-binding protein WhiA [Clostridiales bacterium]|nr:DNA-binding protein WhiA [Clostridiales bacterium]